MKQTRYPQVLSTKLTKEQRTYIENLAEVRKLSIGEATRLLLDEAIRSRGASV